MTKAPLPSPKSTAPPPPTSPSDSSASPTARSHLQRQAKGALSHQRQHQTSNDQSSESPPLVERYDDTTESELSDSAQEESPERDELEADAEGFMIGLQEKTSPDELQIERLRNLQLLMLQKQQQQARLRGASGTGSSGGSPRLRQVSPIKEEPMQSMSPMSPTLEGAFSTPLATSQTASTESTESANTIRGSVPSTPLGHPLRTPSYPFPTVPNTPRAWPSLIHQPFTALSPTVSAVYSRDFGTPRECILSDTSTPTGSAPPFAPVEVGLRTSDMEDPRFPTPNLYDLVLLLGAEPGLEAWWNCVTTILKDWYGAARATLAVPADASDVENVPWGQKSTFDISTHKQHGQGRPDQKDLTEPYNNIKESEHFNYSPTTLIPEKRPKLPQRHSFSGHERQKKDVNSEGQTPVSSSRPRGPLRAASHAPQSILQPEHPLRQVSQASFDGASYLRAFPTSEKETTFSDPEFSSFGSDVSPPSAVFSMLRALHHEPDALIGNMGINRVLERGRLVTLTRDYSPSLTTSRKNSSTDPEEEQPLTTAHKHIGIAGQEPPKSATFRKRANLTTRSGVTDQSDIRLRRHYEEYEQIPSSPWAQSPAPSPAIQNDPEENPFFAAGNVNEETFNPSTSTQDYAQFGQVEAIGVDRASTITHIPLMHPILSQPMYPQEFEKDSETPPFTRSTSDQSDQAVPLHSEDQRKAPIAIISILSPTVPYPRNLTNSLKHLGPHLATSFANASQFTNAQAQVSGTRNRRFTLGHQVGFAPMSDQGSLNSLLHLDLENISGSTGGSMTSPSDYSGRSKYSPGETFGGTPGWDPTNIGLSNKQSIPSTPGHLAGSEAVESYFDSKKRTTRTTSRSSPPPQDQMSRKSDKRTSKRASVRLATEDSEEVVATPPSGKVKTEDMSGLTGSSRRPRMTIPQASHVRAHSLLHSYGADFSSSFQSLPAATTPGNQPQAGFPDLTRRDSFPENQEMPPPSESLLRTIIDSLPVQIFTALPTTGALTWVNTKFLVYRGRDSNQVLQDPWDAIHPEDRDLYLEQWNKSLRTGQQLQQKVRLQRFDGNYRWFYVRVAPLKNKRQQIVHWIGTNMDFHDQHLAESNSARQQETAASEAKYRALANSSPQVVFVVSNRRGLTFCNSQWITYSGQTEAQAHVNGFLECVHPDDVIKCKLPEMGEDGAMPTNVPTSMPPDHVRTDSSSSEDSSETERAVTSPDTSPGRMAMPQAKLSKLASTGILKVTKDANGRPSYSTEVRLRSKEGEYRWHLVRVLLENSLTGESNEEIWYGTATDINDHKLLEQTLKETMDAKTRFLSNMSHEIRTPLNGISGMVNFLLDSPLITEQLEHVNIIKASTDSLLNLINDILDLSKVEAGMIKLNMELLHIPSLLEEVNDLNMSLAIQKGLELNYLMEEDVPVMVKGDKFRIRQVLLNIVGNAIKFTEKGEVFVRCRLSGPERTGLLKENETMVQFEVIDSGRGFTEKDAKYLFKRFSQIDASSTRQHGGTGLGLAISMQFVELHGGKMDARSVPGKGSTFFFTIKFGLPSENDRSALSAPTLGTPGVDSFTSGPPIFPQPSSLRKPTLSPVVADTRRDRVPSIPFEQSESVKSPVPSLTASERSRDSPALSSSSSDPSLTGRLSLRSDRSSASSFLQASIQTEDSHEMNLALPLKRPGSAQGASSDDSSVSLGSDVTPRPAATSRSLTPLEGALQPLLYSILVVCPLEHSREATIRHIKNTLPEGIPHQITGQISLVDAQQMIGGENPVLFTHIVLVLHETAEIVAVMDQILNSLTHSAVSIVIVSDPAQKKELLKIAPAYDYEQLFVDRRLQFIYRPLKPSKFGIIFDPRKERDSSTDRNQDSAQAVVVSQKLVFEELKRRVGDKGHKVLLVEDNKINQTVVLKFLAKISLETETVLDGVQCTDAVFSKPAGYYSIILCDLHMPNKDGYHACKEIRRWEKKHAYRRHPIIALSANVLGDVYAKCVDAGFNSYVTKPVEFKELSLVMTKFLDPDDKTKGPEPMKVK